MAGWPPDEPARPLAGHGPALAVVAAGGVLGALARYGLGVAFPHRPGGFPLTTLAVNAAGCLLIGALIVILTERTSPHPLARPFLTTGVLGGFTTFSTFATDAEQLLRTGQLGAGLGYLVGTPVLALAATWTGLAVARAGGRRR